MRVAVKNHALPVYKKNRIASLLCIFESTISEPIFKLLVLYNFGPVHEILVLIAPVSSDDLPLLLA